ncbi:hypothetical protein Tco_1086685 [Tanacetum coccineum]
MTQANLDKNPHSHECKAKEVEALRNYNEAANDEEDFFIKKPKLIGSWNCANNNVNEQHDFEGVFGSKLNNEEALNMVKEVSDNEIKNAMFDIGVNKTPSPDGYTSTFLKKHGRLWAMMFVWL